MQEVQPPRLEGAIDSQKGLNQWQYQYAQQVVKESGDGSHNHIVYLRACVDLEWLQNCIDTGSFERQDGTISIHIDYLTDGDIRDLLMPPIGPNSQIPAPDLNKAYSKIYGPSKNETTDILSTTQAFSARYTDKATMFDRTAFIIV